MENIINEQIKESHRAWYQEPLVWLIISLPLSAVLAGFYTFYLAVVTYDGLVVDDYYKQGLAINKRLEKQEMANGYGLKPDMQFNFENNKLRLILNSSASFNYPDSIGVTLSHATKLGHDQVLVLTRKDNSIYESGFDTLIPGHWNVILEGQDWRLVESVWR